MAKAKAAAEYLIKGLMGEIDPRYDPRVGSVERLANLEPNVISRGTLDDVPRVSLSSLEGMPFVTTMSDRTRAGGLLAGINDVDLNMPVNLQGGQDFMFENPGMVWASAPGVVNQIIKLLARLVKTRFICHLGWPQQEVTLRPRLARRSYHTPQQICLKKRKWRLIRPSRNTSPPERW